MKKIIDELKRVSLLIKKINGDIYLDRKYKDDLEWWVLGKMTELLKASNEQYPVYADKLFPPEPDFITYDVNRNKFNPIEVTEVIDPKRKRSDEYKNSFKLDHTIVDSETNIGLWNTLKQRLNNKFLHKYENDCWLLIYFDITYSKISPYGYWHRAIINKAKIWFESKKCNTANCSYEKILVINSGGGAIVSLYPQLNVISSERI